MHINDLLKNIKYTSKGNLDIDILNISYDSRQVSDGTLFFCIKGYNTDGHKYAASAVKSGAICLVVSEEQQIDVPQIIVEDTRIAMAVISANFYGNPADKLMMIGITGTNGKTTSTYMLKRILEESGKKVGLIGTIECIIGDKKIVSERTTPESLDLQKILKEMHDCGCDSVVMEVSSHSLYLNRVYGIQFDGAVYTNLTQDHLDFHKDMNDYAKAKSILFATSKNNVINIDDDFSDIMIQNANKFVTYSVSGNAKYMAKDIKLNENGSRFVLTTDNFKIPIVLNIPGDFNVYNGLGVISLCLELGIDLVKVKKGIESLENVSGRFQSLDTHGKKFSVILDYSHTPDSLKNAIKTIRGFAKGRVITIFGCGGNRDGLKRPVMGEISGNLSDFTIITSDNPRFEDPCDIIKQIVVGIESTDGDYVVIEDRREAIKYALSKALSGDVILLAGKGHENYQEIKGIKYPFDEAIIVEELMNELYPS